MATRNEDVISRIFQTFAVTSKSRYVYIYDIARNFARWSPNAVEYFGLSSENILHAREEWESHIHPEDLDGVREQEREALRGAASANEYQYRAKGKSGEYVVCSCRLVVIKDYTGKPAFFACSITNHGTIDNNDPITDLPNHYELFNRMRGLRAARKPYFILLFNFSDFASINRRFGYMFGNQLLRAISNELVRQTRGIGNCYRGEGTVFCYCTEYNTQMEVQKLYESMRMYLRESMVIEGQKVSLELFGSLVCAASHDIDEHAIYTSALYALDQSRKKQNGDLVIYRDNEQDHDQTNMTLMNEVRKSIVINHYQDFRLDFQPIVSADQELLMGMETLLRWNREPYGEVSPSQFIPWLEKDPMFYTLGNWILENALKAGVSIRRKYPNFIVHVNLGYMQLERSDFRSTLLKMLRETSFPCSSLCLELPAGAIQMNPDHLKSQVETLKSWGVRVSLDVEDFSAMNLLMAMPIDQIRLGPEFVAGIERNQTRQYEIEAISGFANNMRVRVCVAGIEDSRTAAFLRRYPISFYQGYYYSRPVSLEEFYQLPMYRYGIEQQQ